MLHNTETHTLLMMLKTRGSAPYLKAACDKKGKTVNVTEKEKKDFERCAQVLQTF